MADDKKKLAGHRKSVLEHIEKYKKYTQDHEKAFALKTIRNVQTQIKKIMSKHPHWESKPEDTWNP
ncbi:MAG: hypothetical protein AB8B55_06780 [Mariniblastus sp.]